MKALSVRAPWWWFILHGGKDIENRNWATRVRGRVAIHASKWWTIEDISLDFETACRIAQLAFPADALRANAIYQRDARGCIVGTVEIVDCVAVSDSPWFCGEFGFVLRNPIAFEKPIPCRGSLGFFDLPVDVEARLPG